MILVRVIFVTLALFGLWLAMSGIYKPLIIGFGVISSLLCVWIVHRLNLLQRAGMFSDVRPLRFLRYLFWLTVEIGKADWAVSKVILAPTGPNRQKLIKVPITQRTDFAKMIYANSITITPGTVTVRTDEDSFLVHALTDNADDRDALADMDQRVTNLERSQGRRV